VSAWRKEAAKRLPELQRIIASRDVDGPMMLWIELHCKFSELCDQTPLPLDLLRRIWGYAVWSLAQGGDVGNAAAVAFCEHLIQTRKSCVTLPQLMSRRDLEAIRGLLLYHNTEEEFKRALACFDEEEARVRATIKKKK
jgi:hypothetical protein